MLYTPPVWYLHSPAGVVEPALLGEGVNRARARGVVVVVVVVAVEEGRLQKEAGADCLHMSEGAALGWVEAGYEGVYIEPFPEGTVSVRHHVALTLAYQP